MDPAEERFEADAPSGDVSDTIVLTVAAYSNRATDDLPPLFRTLDPDALDALVDSIDDGRLTFPYADHLVTVLADGTVSIEPLSEGGA